MENFNSLNITSVLLDNLNSMKYHTPTPVQVQTLPFALKGRDILATAQTGTGKTGAYGIAAINNLLQNEKSSTLILAPTRELAVQVLKVMEQMLGRRSHVKTALLIGGDSMLKQLSQLQNKPRLIVGTPGRVNDHLERQSLKLHNVDFLVLDETDRMLDMGFEIQLEQIFKQLPKERQTLMFSATLPNNILKISAKYLNNAERISVGSHIAAADTIEQEVIKTTEAEKHDILLNQLDTNSGSCIIFVKTKVATEKLAHKLREQGHSADAIHGDLRQRVRERVIKSFRSQKYRILVATDVAARGLDIPHIEHVVNYDLPQCEEDFIHRIGRTGRAGKNGKAVSLITPQDNIKWLNICRMMNPNEKVKPLFEDRFENKRNDRRDRKRSSSRSEYGFFDRKSSDRSSGRSFGRNSEKPRFASAKSEGESSFRSPRRDENQGKFSARPDFGSSRSESSSRKFSSKPSFASSRDEGSSNRFSSKPSFASSRDEGSSNRFSSKPGSSSSRGERSSNRLSSKPGFRGEGRRGSNSFGSGRSERKSGEQKRFYN